MTLLPSRRRTRAVGDSNNAHTTPVHSVVVNNDVIHPNVLDAPKPTKIRYVDQAIPPTDALSEFVEKLIAPPITLPELRIADQIPAMC
jgi:hypothetical protein